MKLLLDTHALLWWLADDPTLSRAAREAIEDGENEVFVSAASAWEMAIKASLGKLTVPTDLEAALAAEGFTPLPIHVGHGLVAGALPPHHADPFDRMLVAQAQLAQCALVTRDEHIARYGVTVVVA